MKRRIRILFIALLVGVAVSTNAGNWSDFGVVLTKEEVVLSYRQQLQSHG